MSSEPNICNTPGVEQAGLWETEQRREIKQRTGRGARTLPFLHISGLHPAPSGGGFKSLRVVCGVASCHHRNENGMACVGGLVDPCSAYEFPQSAYLGADMAESPLTRYSKWLVGCRVRGKKKNFKMTYEQIRCICRRIESKIGWIIKQGRQTT